MIKLSIITINYNNKEGLVKTVKSVINQTYKDFEYIIIDGGSTDGSKEYIEKNKEHFTYWVSELDKGIYHAMNKGIKVAKGEYCLFLNSGDWLLNEKVLKKVFDNFPTDDILYGNLKSNHRDFIYPRKITLATFINYTIPHQGSFIKRVLFDKYGLYDESYKIVSDWSFFLKAIIINDASYIHLNIYISFFEHGGISTSLENHKAMVIERTNILKSLFPKIYPDYLEMKAEIKDLSNALNCYKRSRIITFIRYLQQNILKRK